MISVYRLLITILCSIRFCVICMLTILDLHKRDFSNRTCGRRLIASDVVNEMLKIVKLSHSGTEYVSDLLL
jgi:hypothetical protein